MKKLFFVTLSLLIMTIGGSLFLGYAIFFASAEHLNRELIQASLLTETTVYYRDGVSKVGTFFEGVHRQYLQVASPINIDSNPDSVIPPLFLKAIVASEDQHFYEHIGISISGIFRAILANILAGRVVQGASTLTQQTSELLFEHRATNRWQRWTEKFWETIDAFRLELRYSKDQILEFYTNLFYVHGTGQGLAIAARYYFDKNVSQLNLAEISFIAGSVKGPNNYNPFRTNDPEKRKKIIQRATTRRNYVLNNMLELGFIGQKEFEEFSKDRVSFRRGDFRFQQSHQIIAVKNALQSNPIKTILADHGIKNLSTAELNIYTTLDPRIQEASVFEMKRHLSSLEFRLSPYTEPTESPVSPVSRLRKYGFYIGTIIQVTASPAPFVQVEVGPDQATISEELLEEFVSRLLQTSKELLTPWHYQRALKVLKKGKPVLLALHERSEKDELWKASIERYPQLNGGVFVLQEGEVRAMAGGFLDHGFNRALNAKRQPGSTFKLLLFLAALELGWVPLEPISNQSRVYEWQRQLYFPSPDHQPPDPVSSMVWAGAKSENLASIYLLEHLLRHVNLEQFTALMDFTKLSQQPKESRSDYVKRIRDDLGIIDASRYHKHAIFESASYRLQADFPFDSTTREAEALNSLSYGYQWQNAYQLRQGNAYSDAEAERHLLKHSYTRMIEQYHQLLAALRQLKGHPDLKERHLLENLNNEELSHFFIQSSSEIISAAPLAYAQSPEDLSPSWKPLTVHKLNIYQRFWSEETRQGLFSQENIWIDGKIRASVLQILEDLVAQKLEEVAQLDRYTPERLYWHHDFRVMVGLQILIRIAKSLGVTSDLKPILSFPLGSNEVTLSDLALMYQTFVTGTIRYPSGEHAQNRWNLINRIEDTQGNVLYQADFKRQTLFSSGTLESIQETLRSVVEYGTGKSSQDYLTTKILTPQGTKIIRIPTYGKTGTANNYSNATYVGFLPMVEGGQVSLRGAYTIASYVGFDQQTEEKALASPYKISGASGALPVWASISRRLIQLPEYRQKLQLLEVPETSSSPYVIPIREAHTYKQTVSLVNGIAVYADQGNEEAVGIVHLPPHDPQAPRNLHMFSHLLK